MYIKSGSVELNYKLDRAKKSKAMVIFNHGFAEHLSRYDYVSKAFNDAGYSTLRYDLRGHGETLSPKGHIDSYKDFIADCKALVDYAKSLYPEEAIYILGHSMGGFVSVLYGLTYPDSIEGQILSGPALGDLPAVKGIKKVALKTASSLLPKLMISNPVEDAICSDPKVVEAYKKDPLVLKKATLNFYKEFTITGQEALRNSLENYDLPVLILHGEKDSIVPASLTQTFMNSIQSKDKERKIYPGLYHEIFNEFEKDNVIKDAIQWLDDRAVKRIE